MTDRGGKRGGSGDDAAFSTVLQELTASDAPQGAAATNPSVIGGVMTDRGDKRAASGGEAAFSAVLQELTANDSSQSAAPTNPSEIGGLMTDRGSEHAGSTGDATFPIVLQELTASDSPQSGAPTNPSVIGRLMTDRGGKRATSGGDSPFSAVLQELTTSGSPPSAPAGAQRGKGSATNLGLADDDADIRNQAAQTRDTKAQSSLAAAAAIAAIVSPQSGVAALATEQTSASGGASRLGSGGASAARILAAQLNKQAVDASAAEDGAAMPSEATTLAFATTSTVARSVVEAHVQRARTYLGVDGVAQSVKANAGASSLVETGAAKSAGAAASDESLTPASDHPSSGDSAARQGPSSDGGTGAGSGRRGGAEEGVSVERGVLAASGPTPAATSAIGTSSIDVDQLADVIADHARALASQGASGTTAAVGANPVKELDVRLNPADLGSLTVKMRIADGNLAIVIEAEKSSTAKLIDGERSAIVERLASVDQPLASVVIKASENGATQAENGNASGSSTPQQGDGQNSAANGSGGQTRSSRSRDDQAQARRADSTDSDVSGRARSGDLFV
jgi:hypothetical protein